MRGLVTIIVLAFVLTGVAQAKISPQRIAYWRDCIHPNEQPNWYGGFPNFPGGLGISRGAWNDWAGELGLLDTYPNGASAPPLVQIRVADYGWRAHRGSWGSMSKCGYPPG